MYSNSVFQFSVRDLAGKDVPLSDYKGKVLLIVNTASRCGFTPQFNQLQTLYDRYKDQDFEILAFPSNNFGKQEPLEGDSIQEFCSLEFKTTFKVFDKVQVVGNSAIPLYQFLSAKSKNQKFNSKPRWNFHKYLIDKEGRLVDYFYTFTSPMSKRIRKKIDQLL